MTDKNYLMLNDAENTIDNSCVWNGDENIWKPPSGYTLFDQEITSALVWQLLDKNTEYVLVEVVGAGEIGFTYNGSCLVTNKPQPKVPVAAPDQPITTGTQTL